jgi:DUF4097 and DUF4098 domain-containing protein YvlB
VPRSILVNPDEVKKPGVLKSKDIPLNWYKPDFQEELKKYWKGEWVTFRSYCNIVEIYSERVRALCRELGIHYIPVAENVRGDLSLNGRVNDVNVENLQGSLRLTGDFFGTTRLAKIANSVHFQSSRTDLEIARLDGDLVLESGDLRASSLAGPTRVITRSKGIRLDGFTGNVHIEDTNSDIELTPGKLPLGSFQITNHRGSIHLVLPANAAFQLEAHTTQGEISSDFSGVKVESRARGAQATGSIGSGGLQIQLSTDRGDLEIRKG